MDGAEEMDGVDIPLGLAFVKESFASLGVKSEELGEDPQDWKARVVFQGNRPRTVTGTPAAAPCEEAIQ